MPANLNCDQDGPGTDGTADRHQAGGSQSQCIGQRAEMRLDPRHSRRQVHVGGEGGVLAAWPALCGVWVGPAADRATARDVMGWQGLQSREGTLVIVNASDAAADRSLQQQGLRLAGPWTLLDDMRKRVCAPAHKSLWTLEGLAGTSNHGGICR